MLAIARQSAVLRAAPTHGSALVSLVRRCYASVAAPAGLRYSKSHEWISISNGVGKVGISDYAANSLGDVVFVDLPAPGTKVEQEGTSGAVESVKAVSDVYSPVAGEIVEANEELRSQPALINSSPYEKGWLFKIKLSEPKQAEELMDAAAYAKYCLSAH